MKTLAKALHTCSRKLLPLALILTSFGCSNDSQKKSQDSAAPAAAADSGSFAFVQPDLEQQKIDTLVLDLVNSSNASHNKTHKYIYKRNSQIKADNIKSGTYTVKISAYSSNKLILTGSTSVLITENNTVEAHIELEQVTNANSGSLIVKVSKKADSGLELACEYAQQPMLELCEVGNFICTYEHVLAGGTTKKYEEHKTCGANFAKTAIYANLCAEKVAFTEAENAKIKCKKI